MCAGCSLINVPVCSAGALCGASLHEVLGLLAAAGGAGLGTLKQWGRTPKRQHPQSTQLGGSHVQKE